MDIAPRPHRDAFRRAALLALILSVTSVAASDSACSATVAEARADSSDDPAAADDGFHMSVVPPKMSFRNWYALPTGSYGSQTGLGIGGELLKEWRGSGGATANFPATLSLRGLQTLKGQQSIDGTLSLYFSERAWRWRTRASWADLRRRFWGTGPRTPESGKESYRPEETQLYTEVTRRVSKRLRLGPRFEFAATRYVEVVPGGLLESLRPVSQTEDGIVGAGIVADYDTRDRDISPTSGVRLQGMALQFVDGAGGEYPFFNTNLDFRAYAPLGSGSVLAGQFFFFEVTRSAPLWRYAQLGGRAHSRAYPRGRFTDRALAAFQLELRQNLAGRFGMSAFAGAGTVAGDADLFRIDALHPSWGGGIRFRLSHDGGAMGRLDMALGDQGNRQFYFGLDEAF